MSLMKRFLKESKSTNKDVYTKNRAADLYSSVFCITLI
ncbi:hypothetical protein RUMTOR_00413 [[Ruminococcus] torques ATCC 27756]|uniref:Uncharacterized protein n=1 Tax=[Ruminococcus] torques ATCC 27756 TaxID=411460 RepID=A5KJL5_9FIRM|nr:hypothetical protein RUMTOR_00413 [[Ruminococcus] torques ATCC 27756]